MFSGECWPCQSIKFSSVNRQPCHLCQPDKGCEGVAQARWEAADTLGVTLVLYRSKQS